MKTDHLLFKISSAPVDEQQVTEVIERILVPLLIDLPVDVLFAGDGVEWLEHRSSDQAFESHVKAKLGLLSLYGMNAAMALADADHEDDRRFHQFTAFPVESVKPDQLGQLLSNYTLVR